MQTIWTCTLAIGGRVAEEFKAEIVDDGGTLHIIRHAGFNTCEVSVHEVRGDYLLRALADAARGKAG